ncbi:GH3 auxin-responsive promoter family protein [Virgisporangium ochraceum]|uniref:GH3 middle domain-containing protein n=1 Tax=Virgisporangium ochraceum TaxID=65505 RepID=A0A8J3ZX07_9ACTN|nr:GH3 auxin-responsive promoter family protein [Virgisporangium ochraceum]GIJ70743.1 hypothetical protein Voc01_056600 [Virgisporangium ochraceum]
MPAASTGEYRRRVRSERDGFLRLLAEPALARQRVLDEVVSANAGTAFGREHGFARVRTGEDFRRAVPIRTYDGLAPWIDRAAAGERGVLSADDPVVFFMSSGTTGDSKKIPVTRRFMRTGFFPPYYTAWATVADHYPDVLADDSTLNLKFDPVSRTASTASGRPHLGASQVDLGTAFGEPLSAEPGSRAVWGELPVPVADTDHLEKAYLRLRLAVEHDVRMVVGINPAMVAAVPYQLARWWPRIVKDLRDGTLGGRPYGSPNPHRAAGLERLADMFGTLTPAHVWPRFRVLFCWTTGLASLYLPGLAASFGTDVVALPAPVAASEGFVAVGVDRHGSGCSPALGAAFHEFVPADDGIRADSATMSFEELETGQEYHVVLSHVGGLYRYALGDVVRVVDRLHGMPRVCYAGRGTTSDVAGERLRESHVVHALRTALRSGGLAAHNATCRPVRPDGPDAVRYEFAVSPRQALNPAETVALARALDDGLVSVSPGYRAARAAAALAEPVVHVLTADAFAHDWHARVGSGIRPAQVKDRVFQRDDDAWHRLLSHTVR